MEIQPPRPGSTAPPPGTGERGFDKLQNPLGMTLVALSLLVFAMICFFGSRYVREISRKDEAKRKAAREEAHR